MRAMGGRPVLMERYPHGAEGKSFFQKRVPDNAPDWLTTEIVSTPNGTTSRALGDRRPRARRVGRESRLPRLPRVAGARGRSRSRRRAPHRSRSRRPAPTSKTRARSRHSRTRCSTSSGSSASRRPPASTASTCTCGSRRAGIRIKCGTRPSRSRVSSRAAIPTRSPTRGGRKSAANASSSTSTRTRRTRRCSARGAFGRGRARRCRRRSRGTSSRRSIPTRRRSRACPGASPSAATRGPTIDTEPQSIEPLLAIYDRDIANGMTDAPWPPVYPKMPGEPPRVAPSRAKKPKPDRINTLPAI